VHQVATGTVMLLIVSVGLWSLPQLTRRPRFDAGAGHEPLRSAKHATEPAAATLEHSGETSTSPASQPPIAASSIHTEAARSSDLEAGLVHYHAREYAAATPLLSRALVSAGGADQAMTLLYLARAERALGHCDRAVNSYATLVRVHSKKVEAAAALREGVACYDDMAEPEHAQHLLEQAATTASLGGDARRLLAQRASNVKKPPSAPHGPTASSH
jgi:tetratricopeptide (TPR) repeat protein